MCGFVGYLDPSAAPDRGLPLLKAMTDAIAYRGPDEQGHWADAGVGVGHRRLSIVGLSTGQQPMHSADGGLVVVYNGEVFNYVELKAELEAKGRRFRTGSDTEVLLHLYEMEGPDFVRHLNGDYAFALWDRRRRRLVLARDRMGVRPLYYARVGDGLYFASEVKALLEVPGVRAELDPVALDQIFTLWAPIPPRTPFKDVFELPPAHLMIVEGGRTEIRPYWSLDYPDADEVEDAPSPEQAAAEALALLGDATRIRLRADVPVGSYLSGGLDSSVISALAARQRANEGGLSTFSVAFASREHDESEHQVRLADAIGSRHSAVMCHGGDIARVFPDVVAHTEQPILRTAPAPLYLLAQRVREEGLKVVLTGEGADEVFAGYDIFKEAKVRRFCARQPSSKIRPLLFKKLYPYLPGLRDQSAEYLAAFFGVNDARLDDPLFSHRPRLRNTASAKLFFSPELRERLKGYDAADELVSRLPARFGRWHPLHQAQYLEASWLLPGYILSAQGDRMAMAHGVEGRFPYLDHRLVELAARMTPETKVRGLVEKHVLRQAARDILPPESANRAKQPYRAPDSSSFMGNDAPDYVRERLAPAAIAADGFFNPGAVEKLVSKARMQGLSGFRDNAAFVGILSTSLWHETFTRRGRAA